MQFQNNKQIGIPIEMKELMGMIDNFYGDKSRRMSISIESKSLQYLLYNSFEVKFQIGDRYGEFGAGIVIGSIVFGPEILPGRRIQLDSSKESVINNLQLIDEYCRLRLPDKFLQYHGW